MVLSYLLLPCEGRHSYECDFLGGPHEVVTLDIVNDEVMKKAQIMKRRVRSKREKIVDISKHQVVMTTEFDEDTRALLKTLSTTKKSQVSKCTHIWQCTYMYMHRYMSLYIVYVSGWCSWNKLGLSIVLLMGRIPAVSNDKTIFSQLLTLKLLGLSDRDLILEAPFTTIILWYARIYILKFHLYSSHCLVLSARTCCALYLFRLH